ncbi:hypothetical protein BH11ARM2_BH11ARM2_02940 [soil metagenome]
MSPEEANFLATVDRMASGDPATDRVEEDGFVAWLAPGDPPVANFAFVRQVDPWSARRLAEIAGRQGRFRVYASRVEEVANEVLDRAGFVRRGEARIMLASPGGDPGGLAPEQEEDPREVAVFVADQFFARAVPARRDAFARSIASAPDTRLVSVRDRGGIVAAAMLSSTEGMLGIYNLCVAPRRRGVGIGTELVRWVLAHSSHPVTLQSDPSLEPWYRKSGFRTVGAVQFYGLASSRDSDTM